MRTQLFPYVRLFGLTAMTAGLVAAVGCDTTSAGQAGDPKGPPKLVRVMIQDGTSVGTARKFAVDLLEVDPKVPCDEEINLCVPAYAIQGTQPGLACVIPDGATAGTCLDPLVPPAAGVPIEGGPSFVAIRVVFNKLLADDSVEPGMMFDGNLIQLLDDTGTEVETTKFFDRAGSPDFTSDVIKSPFGPALVAKPKAILKAGTEYTIRVQTSNLRDRQGNKPVKADGVTALADTTELTFKTETLKPRAATSYAPPVIAPSEVLHFTFWAPIKLSTVGDPTPVNLVVEQSPVGFTAADLKAYGATKKDMAAADCLRGSASDVTYSIFPNLGYWPAGHYKLTVGLVQVNGPTFPFTYEFDVDPAHDIGAGTYDVSKFPPPTCAS
jgi:hypothetical protein